MCTNCQEYKNTSSELSKSFPLPCFFFLIIGCPHSPQRPCSKRLYENASLYMKINSSEPWASYYAITINPLHSTYNARFNHYTITEPLAYHTQRFSPWPVGLLARRISKRVNAQIDESSKSVFEAIEETLKTDFKK